MMDISFIERSINEWSKPLQMAEFAVVPTMLTYPSNSAVMIYVEGGRVSFLLSDGGGATDVLAGAGGHRVDGISLLRDFCRSTDFHVSPKGWISTEQPVSQSEFLGTLCTLAQHSKDAAAMLLRHFKPHRDSDFRQELEDELDRRFRNHLSKRGHLVGQSNKRQTFDFLLRLTGGRVLALDAVVPESGSINSALVAHMDVRAAGRRDVEQMIVYDDRENWKSSDLALLSMGVPPTAYSQISNVLERLVV